MLPTETIDRLAAFEPVPFPVPACTWTPVPMAPGDILRSVPPQGISGTAAHLSAALARTCRASIADVDRIKRYLANELQPSANGVAIFACAGADGFEALQLDAPIEEHRSGTLMTSPICTRSRVSMISFSLRSRGRPHQLRPHLRLQHRPGDTPGRDPGRQDEGDEGGRLVAGALPASCGRIPPAARQGDRRRTRSRRARRTDPADHALAGDDVFVLLVRGEFPQHLLDKVARCHPARHRCARAGRAGRHARCAPAEGRRTPTPRLWIACSQAVRGSDLGVLGAEDTLAALQLGQVDELAHHVDARYPDQRRPTRPGPAGAPTARPAT